MCTLNNIEISKKKMRPFQHNSSFPSELKLQMENNPQVVSSSFLSLLLSQKSQHIVSVSCVSPQMIRLPVQRILCLYRIPEVALKKCLSSICDVLDNSLGLINRKDIGETTGKYLLRFSIERRKIDNLCGYNVKKTPSTKTIRLLLPFLLLYVFAKCSKKIMSALICKQY